MVGPGLISRKTLKSLVDAALKKEMTPVDGIVGLCPGVITANCLPFLLPAPAVEN